MYNTGKKNRDVPTTKCKIEFSKFLQILCTAKIKKKKNLVHLAEASALILNS